MEQHTAAPATKAASIWIVVWITMGLSLVALTIGIIALVTRTDSPGRPGKDGNPGQDGKDGNPGQDSKDGETGILLTQVRGNGGFGDVAWTKTGYVVTVTWHNLFFNGTPHEYNIPAEFQPTESMIRHDTCMIGSRPPAPTPLTIELTDRTDKKAGVLRFTTNFTQLALAPTSGFWSYIA
jgi:hypothetical protein